MPPLRLQRYLSQAGIASRRRAEQLIASGSVKVNGKVVNTPGVMVAERDRVEVDGKRAMRVDPIYRVLLKPRACLATLAAGGERTTLRRYVRDAEPGLAVVAPLDFPAEGVVLLTTDGELADAISKRGQKVPMTYHLKFQGVVGDDDIGRLMRGWRWEDVPVRPTAMTSLATTGKNTWVEMVVPEIRPRALKAAGDLIRHSVLKISRVRLGRLSFEGLEMGGWRDLSKSELGDLRQAAGLSHGTSDVASEAAQLPKPRRNVSGGGILRPRRPLVKEKKSKQESRPRPLVRGK
jgi:23S rRNA pseudouridine2605 synthase